MYIYKKVFKSFIQASNYLTYINSVSRHTYYILDSCGLYFIVRVVPE